VDSGLILLSEDIVAGDGVKLPFSTGICALKESKTKKI